MGQNTDNKSLLPNFLFVGLPCLIFLFGISIVMGKGCSGGSESAAHGGKDFVGILQVQGVIASGPEGGLFAEPAAGSDHLVRLLKSAEKNKHLKALVIRINSPGGSAPASEEIYQALKAFKKKTGIPVVISMADVAASGGYFIAAAGDRIFANRSTFTASIGVIMPLLNYEGLFNKVGLSSSIITSGKFKDIGSPTRAMTKDEKVMLQTMSDQVHRVFMEAVAEGRKMDLAKLKKVADGRIMTGEQAMKAGLVDEIGTFTDAIKFAGTKSGLGEEPLTGSLKGKSSLINELFGEIRAPKTPGLMMPTDPLSLAAATMLLATLPGISP